ncbi:MAG: 2-amino-4-hydroxy-6-hydroxymethyldihydropteridine diphosphokinase [Myxococcales bacterium]|nr:2-amino-4-hydroxy-6-hydroxymethyldihydropteridine diphosphokinase [Myxococcales bacterium]
MDGTAYIGLGSNMGDRLANLQGACRLLREDGTKILASSALYQSDPMYLNDQPAFLNGVIAIRYTGSPHDLLAGLLAHERTLGRVRSVPNGPRTIDLDVVLLGAEGEMVVDSPELAVPHPLMTERPFVLTPLAEIAGELVHPVLGKTISTLSLECGSEGIQFYCQPSWVSGDT